MGTFTVVVPKRLTFVKACSEVFSHYILSPMCRLIRLNVEDQSHSSVLVRLIAPSLQINF